MHCKIRFPIGRLRLAWEVVLRGALAIVVVACAAVARQIGSNAAPALDSSKAAKVEAENDPAR